MSSEPEVSVVMSAYNGSSNLRETIDSILAQEGVSLEFVIVNDGSTDETCEILDEYQRRESRIRVLQQDNQGLTRALIRGCAEARGEYIARQDVGDVSLPNRLVLQTAALASDADLAFVSCWAEFCGPQWEFLYLVRGTGEAKSPTAVLSETTSNGLLDGPTCHPSVTFRREIYKAVGGYRREFYYGQDWDLWYRLAAAGKFQVIQESLYKVRLSEASVTASSRLLQSDLARLSHNAMLRRVRGLSDNEILDQASKIRSSSAEKSSRSEAQALYFIGECLRRNNDSRAKSYFRRAIKRWPLYPSAWSRLAQTTLQSRTRSAQP